MRELRPLFAQAGISVVDLRAAGIAPAAVEDALEDASTFEGNALAKARYFHRLSRLPTIADDSGLEVIALGGAPGVHSKRWSGRSDIAGDELDAANNALLLRSLEGHADRRARYVCVAAYCDGHTEFVERGEATGTITTSPRGFGGFGYDPYFESDELKRTFGEVALQEKSSVSHRARAFAKLLQRLAPRR
jgi:XTP/dITP diphosphohydrolase